MVIKRLPHDISAFMKHIELLDSTLYLSGTQAASADIDTLYLSVNNRAHALDVRLPLALRPNVGMADMHSGQHPLCTNLADSCHDYTPPSLYTDTAESPHTQQSDFTIRTIVLQVFC